MPRYPPSNGLQQPHERSEKSQNLNHTEWSLLVDISESTYVANTTRLGQIQVPNRASHM